MNRLPAFLALVTALLALGACGRSQVAAPAPPTVLTNLLVQPEQADEIDYRILWQTSLATPPRNQILYAELLGDRLATFETNHILSVVNIKNGTILWRRQIGKRTERFSRPVRAADNRLVICSASRGYVYDIDTGELLNVFTLAHASGTSPLISGNFVVHGSPGGLIWAQDLNAGLVRWEHQLGSGISSSPIMSGASMLVTDEKGTAATFNPLTGVVLWRAYTWAPISARPAVSNLLIYVASHDQTLYAYDRNSGRTRWRWYADVDLEHTPVVFEELLFQAHSRKGVVVLDAFTGEPKWTMPFRDATPLMVKGNFLFIHRPGTLLALSRSEGDLVKKIDLPQVDHIFTDNPKGGDLYLLRHNGSIMKMQPQG